MASGPDPLWLSLRAALDEQGYSVRGFARACHEADPSATWDSWKRTINRALDEDADPSYRPSLKTAGLWARLLEKPADYFVRPRARETQAEQIARLRREVAALRRQIAALKEQLASGG